MAYIVVTHNARGILFELNNYSSILGFSKFFRDKTTIQTVSLKPNWIEYTTLDGKTFAISHVLDPAQPNVLKVDSVAGTEPLSLSELFDLIYAILS